MVPPRFFSERRGILGMYIVYSMVSIIRRFGVLVWQFASVGLYAARLVTLPCFDVRSVLLAMLLHVWKMGLPWPNRSLERAEREYCTNCWSTLGSLVAVAHFCTITGGGKALSFAAPGGFAMAWSGKTGGCSG